MGNFFKTVICVLTALIVLAGAAFWGLAGLLPAVDIEDSLRPDAASQYFDDKGELIYTTASEERRIPVSLDKMPKHLQEAFISIEDARFYEHGGIDIRGTARALVVTLTCGDVQGGSTITQQLAKNAFLTNERTITRKIKEAFIARQLEERYTKDEILNMYLNRIYFGQGTYGVECASLYYFGKHVENIDLAEAATLAAIPKSPNYFNPLENPKASKERQELVLDQMVKYGYITQAQADEAKAEKIAVHVSETQDKKEYLSYFFDYCNQFIIDKFGADALYKGGLKIYTTINSDMQQAAVDALQYLPNYYTDDNKLTQPQVALVSLDPTTGYIKAMIGGRAEDKFNRAIMAVRQPGSSFKPFVYLTAMDNGFTPASVVEDKETEFAQGWTPQNSDLKWHGKVSLRTALTRSMNVPTVLVAQQVGVDKILQTAKNLGITTLVEDGAYSDANLAMALGGLSKGVIPVEMAAAYGAIANGGVYVKPIGILKIEDRNGKVIFENKTERREAVDPRAAYLTVDMMKGVFVNGTAAGAGIGRPAAGKTGTTDDFKDAWFVGFTPNLSTAVWIGDDNGRALEYMYGSMQPLSIWRSYMVNAVANLPAVDFVRPSGVEIPPAPKIEQDSDKDKDKDKKDSKDAYKDKNKPAAKKAAEEAAGGSQPAPQKPSMRDRVREILEGNAANNAKPVVSNKPTPAN